MSKYLVFSSDGTQLACVQDGAVGFFDKSHWHLPVGISEDEAFEAICAAFQAQRRKGQSRDPVVWESGSLVRLDRDTLIVPTWRP